MLYRLVREFLALGDVRRAPSTRLIETDFIERERMEPTKNDAMTHPLVTRRLAALIAMACGVMLAGLAGGCSNEKLTTVKDESEFQQLVLESKQPVLVEFSKDNCPTCDILEPELIKVSKGYAGRVKFYKFMLLNRFFQPYSEAIRDGYNLQWVPSVVLFVDGEEKQRWVMDYMGDSYRKALTEFVGPPEPPKQQ